MPALSIRNLTKTYGNGVVALKGIDLDVERGDFFALATVAFGEVTFELVNGWSGFTGGSQGISIPFKSDISTGAGMNGRSLEREFELLKQPHTRCFLFSSSRVD